MAKTKLYMHLHGTPLRHVLKMASPVPSQLYRLEHGVCILGTWAYTQKHLTSLEGYRTLQGLWQTYTCCMWLDSSQCTSVPTVSTSIHKLYVTINFREPEATSDYLNFKGEHTPRPPPRGHDSMHSILTTPDQNEIL